MTKLTDVRDFLGCRRFALIGVSSHEDHFSRVVFQELTARDYDVVPVNPHLTELEGRTAYPNVRSIQPPVEAAMLMVPAAESAQVVRECLDHGIPRLWLYRGGGGPGAVSPEAVEICREAGALCVAGECPLMFLEHAAWFHRAHAFGKKIVGTYPEP